MALATMAAGSIPVHLYPERPASYVDFAATHTGAGLVITDQEQVAWSSFPHPLLRYPDLSDATLPRVRPGLSSDVAYMMFTSGTTGEPKAVVTTQQNVLFVTQTLIGMAGMNRDDREVIVMSLSTTGGLVHFHSNLVLGNLIGTQADGTTAMGNGGNGITLSGAGAVFNTIGGTQPGDGNTIAFNCADGVQVATTAGVGNAIRGNSIFSNGTTSSHLGIDLDADGVTPNDAPANEDADTGPNGLQNFPVITLARVTGSTKTITGTLDSAEAQTFTIDFFASDTCDTSGNGEGQIYLGSMTTAATDANGHVSFTFHPDLAHAAGMTINRVITATATATGAAFNTSEFSACVTVADGTAGAGPDPRKARLDVTQLATDSGKRADP